MNEHDRITLAYYVDHKISEVDFLLRHSELPQSKSTPAINPINARLSLIEKRLDEIQSLVSK